MYFSTRLLCSNGFFTSLCNNVQAFIHLFLRDCLLVNSDLCAGLIGGLGVTPSGNIGEHGAIFESVSQGFC